MTHSAENDARTFVQRVAEEREHMPWWYTEYGVLCSCGRPCIGGEARESCAVMLRAQRWQDACVTPPEVTGA